MADCRGDIAGDEVGTVGAGVSVVRGEEGCGRSRAKGLEAVGFAHDGEGFGQEIVEGGLLGGLDLLGVRQAFEGAGDAGAELGGFGLELLVGEGLKGFLVAVDLGERGEQALDGALVGGPKTLARTLLNTGGSFA